ncbi:hypothetical protein [Salinimicrobium flavum]|uniref:Uncharacterized protein n=1 Tax=Salinimicrobium flavum TaxID=1737065 RepID=A0ABW5J1K9_9FLAO
MNTNVSDPPVLGRTETFSFENFDNNIKFYLAYDYLPLKDIALLIRGVDDLYELVYKALNEERVPDSLKLVLDTAHTGNSIEWVTELLEKAAPSKKALRALYLTGALIYFPATIQNTQADTNKTKADTEKIKAEIQNLEAERELLKVQKKREESEIELIEAKKKREEAEARKADKEAEKLDVEIQQKKSQVEKLEKLEFENFLRKNQFNDELINKILQEENWKKLNKKSNKILETINKGPIYHCTINDFPLIKK